MKRNSRLPSSPVDSSAAPEAEHWPIKATLALLLLLVVLVYFPALKGDFLWDDAGHVTNPELQSWSGLLRIWFEPGATQQYYPVLHTAFWIQHQIWGDATLPYHLMNVLWHSISACLLVVLLQRLALKGALLAGLIFALHPVCVESVAWISEQKNTLSTVLYLAAALAWIRYENERRPGKYAIATLWFLGALLAKTVTATLPAALLVLAWWRRGRLTWRGDVLPLLPWLVLGVGAGLFTAWFERTGIGAQGADFELSMVERCLLAARVFWFYLGKLAWPTDLAFFYPRWEIDESSAFQYAFPIAALALLCGLVWLAWMRQRRGPLTVFLLYVGTLFPALGFVNVYPFIFSYVADHFQYLASLSVFAFAASGLMSLAQKRRFGLSQRGALAVAGIALIPIGFLAHQQSGRYVNSITLYEASLKHSPDSWVAHHNLASELSNLGNPEKALKHARRALELKPDYPEALSNLADILTQLGRATEALPLLERTLQIQPDYAQAHNNFGVALMALQRPEEGLRHFQRAIEIQPSLADAHYNLGLAQADRGNFEEAILLFEETIRRRPDHVGAELNLGVALVVSNRSSEAWPHFERALDLDPESAVLRQTYGRVLLSTGQSEAAIEQLKIALKLDPTLHGLHSDLAQGLQRLGRIEEARLHAAEANRQP